MCKLGREMVKAFSDEEGCSRAKVREVRSQLQDYTVRKQRPRLRSLVPTTYHIE